MKRARRSKISVKPGMTSVYDASKLDKSYWTDCSMVRWDNGQLRLVPPWRDILHDADGTGLNNAELGITGVPTWIFNYFDNTNSRTITLIGTSTRLYVGYDINSGVPGRAFTTFVNITPVVTSTTAIANSLDTYYKTLANNPITTVITSKTITIADTSTKVEAGDSITLSGCSGNPGGIPDSEINTTHTVVSASTNSFTVTVATTNATSSTSAGGASVVLATPIITVNAAAHTMIDGDRTKIASAATTGGIPNTEINAEHIIRNKTTNTFDIVATTKATSSVTGGGGASTTYQKPIDVSNGLSTTAIWSGDLFGTIPVMTNGNAGWLYEWAGSTATAPTRVTNSPDDITMCFVTSNIIVTTYNNTITWCDQGDRTVWTAAATNQAGSDLIEKAASFRGWGSVGGVGLLLTAREAYTFQYIGPPYVFKTELIYSQDGICSKKAIREFEGVLYWMGHKNFYRWYGGRVEEIPNNTLKNYIFFASPHINWDIQENYRYLTCSDTRVRHGEIWWYPMGAYSSGGVAGVKEAIVYSVREGWWTKHDDCKVSACAEGSQTVYEINASYDGYLSSAEHHYDSSPDNSPGYRDQWAWYAHTNYMQIGEGDKTYQITAVHPDLVNSLTYDMTINTKYTSQSSTITTSASTGLDENNEKIDVRISGRMRQYEFSGSLYLSGSPPGFGDWYEEVKLRGSR